MSSIAASVIFSDETYQLRPNSNIERCPSIDGLDITASDIATTSREELIEYISSLYKQAPSEFKEDFEESKKVINFRIAPYIRIMATLEKALDITQRSDELPEIALALFSAPHLSNFTKYLFEKDRMLYAVADSAVSDPSKNSGLISLETLDAIVRQEVTKYIDKMYKIEGVALHGNALNPITDADAEHIFSKVERKFQYAKDHVAEIVDDLKNDVQMNPPRPQFQSDKILKELNTLPGQFEPDLGNILQLALNDEDLLIQMVPNCYVHSGRQFTELLLGGAYSSENKIAYLPMEDVSVLKTLSDEDVKRKLFGDKLNGIFAPVKKAKNPNIPNRTREQVWAEELAHAGIDRLFGNEGLPYLVGDDMAKEKLSRAIVADVERNPAILEIFNSYKVKHALFNDMLAKLTVSHPLFHEETFEVVAKELTAQLAFHHNQRRNMAYFNHIAPNLCAYFKEIVIPKAKEMLQQDTLEQRSRKL